MLRLSRIFTDGVILQYGQPFCVWGWADGDVRLSLCGGGKRLSADIAYQAAANPSCGRKFTARFAAVDDCVASFELTATCGDEVVRVRVRFGNVYLAIGQSNLSYALSGAECKEEIASRAKKADVAFLHLHEKPFTDTSEVLRPADPQEDLAQAYEWVSGQDSDALGGISAIAVAAAVELYERTKIPTAFVVAAMGGLSIEAYLPREEMLADDAIMAFARETDRYHPAETYNTAGTRNFTQSCGVYNEKIAPIEGLRFAATVWYLGESSAWDFRFAEMFAREMRLLVKVYRDKFGGDFVATGIACEYYPYGDKHGFEYVNEALASLECDFSHYTFVPIDDIEPRWLLPDGELYYHPIHPVNKLPVAERVADAILNKTRYPRIANVQYRKGEAVCEVRTPAPLRQGKVCGFTLAGKDGKYYPAEATVRGDKISVTCPDVTRPAALTYAFMLYRQPNMVATESGLPLLPYRTHSESVHPGYCFLPAYLNLYGNETWENCFGYEAGTCRKLPVWRSGEIYAAENACVTAESGVLTVDAHPQNDTYFFFGASPAICLSGHKSHLADYRYMNFELCADADATFMGLVLRAASGDVYRAGICNGGASAANLPIEGQYTRYAVDLSCGIRGDSAPVEFPPELRRSFVQAEFLFRATSPVKVRLRALTLSDIDLSQPHTLCNDTAEKRADTQLPE